METKKTLDSLLNEAWRSRRLFFGDRVVFAAPNRTIAVSVTGNSCALNCAHCGGAYLRSMVSLDRVLGSKKGREKSYLVSGGCDRRGRVPLVEKWAQLKELSGRGALNLHTGLVGEEEAKRLAEIAAVVSFDFIADDCTIRDVYGLPVTARDYLSAYRSLQLYTRVVPHICIGLNGGRVSGEYRALEMLRAEAVEAISLIVFRPTAGTAFSSCSPPEPEEVARFIALARLAFPRIPLYLGCMRPGGRYREKLDSLALQAGVNRVVLPAPAARRRAAELGLAVSISGECCSL